MTAQDEHDATAGMLRGGDVLPPQVPQTGDAEPTRSAGAGAPRIDANVTDTAGQDGDFLIVGIGASAGGLAPLEQFFQAVPENTDMAFVVIQHLSPHRESILPELLARDTGMAVWQVSGDTRVEPGTVYVIPPGADLTIGDGTLYLQQRDVPGERHLPVDTFFRSLADDRAEWGAGIILSGAGADSILGVRTIKEAGGLVIVQDPEDADQSSMPRSAIATGLVDYVLKPANIPEALRNYVEHFLCSDALRSEPVRIEDGRVLQTILAVLRTRTGHDFALYKRNTIIRRVHRRMTVRQVSNIGAYATLLVTDGEEVNSLFKELLIGVTEFFRDPEAFELLEEVVIPDLLECRGSDEPVRVWVPACATGEEAYSVAILIREKMEEMGRQVSVQIFATDIDERAIDVARQGRYPVSIVADVSPERLARFFDRVDNSYVVTEAVRKMIVFAPHSLVKDPPFSHVHLATCRNFLIYLEPELQRSVKSVFEYSLDPGGYLLLGTSEMLPEVAPYFEVVNRKWKLFRRLEARARLAALPELADAAWPRVPVGSVPAAQRSTHLRQQLERALLQHYDPPTLVVDGEGRILFTYGDVGRYLQPSPGEAGGWHVMQILREGLRMPVATAVRHVVNEHKAMRQAGLLVDGVHFLVDVVVRPVECPVALEGLVFVEFFEPTPPEVPTLPVPDEEAVAFPNHRVEELTRELQSTKEYLQAVIEELQSSNEEIRSTNEELQSANEELETSQEEAQSMNEELVTLNNELESRVDELTWANNDMNNVLTSIDVGILFLDRRFQVRRFNRAVTRIVNLIPTDVGRPASHLSSNLADEDWVKDAHTVFETLTPQEREVLTRDERWYSMCLRPYRTMDDAIEGVVLTFGDITEQKQAARIARTAQAVAESVLQTVRGPLLVLDQDLRVHSANGAFYDTFRVAPDETEGRLVYNLGDGQWDIPDLRALLEEIIPRNESFEGYEVDHHFERVGRKKMVLNARRVVADEMPSWVLLAFEEAQ